MSEEQGRVDPAVVRQKWLEKSAELPVVQATQENAKLQEARKTILRVVNWELNDDKHRKLEQIKDTVDFLEKVMTNVKEFPDDEKFRRIKIENAAFSKHIRDAPGGEAFMIAAGWHASVVGFQRSFVFQHQPGTPEWEIFELACAELDKLSKLLSNKIEKGLGGAASRAAELAKRREAALRIIEDDKQERHVKFSYREDSPK